MKFLSSVTDAINEAHNAPETTIGYPNRFVTATPLTPGVNFSAAYSFAAADDLVSYHNWKHQSQRYCRDSNEIVAQLEYYFTVMHGQQLRALFFNSGMSAIAAVLNVFLGPGMTVWVPREVYRKARDLVKVAQTKTTGLTVVEYGSIDEISADGVEHGLIWAESPSNPHLRLTDYTRLGAIKQANPGIVVALDLTFSGLLNYDLGPETHDIIIHSCTKYANGHNDVLAGVVLAKPEHYSAIWDRRSYGGGMLDPMSAFLLFRSLRTYDLRLERQLRNTGEILAYLERHPRVTRIFYPGAYANTDQEAIMKRHHRHGGSVVSFLVDNQPEAILEKVSELRATKMAPSFGSVDTLFEVPSIMSHYGKDDAYFKAIGLERNLVRYSIGCEPVNRLVADLDALL